MMVEQEGCIYCEAWDREIGPGFPKSSEGRTAPLLRVDIDGPWPDGIALDRRPTITPTFILLRGGAELSRLEGYPGDQYFYPLIDGMLTDAGIAAASGKAGG
ncbi:SoxS protein [Paracoccus methylarcula]|uniref:SoxS protein n=2 Tax=Paracoccus methylarcula TaxID=72022 RepID=A0A422QZJ4_9RHOB|nr:SoxS protein [Paracoccus methylarcula]